MIVLDANAAIEIVLKREKSPFLRTILESSDKTITSGLYKIETANALWKYVRARLITKEMSNTLLGIATDLIDEYVDLSENNIEALIERAALTPPSPARQARRGLRP